MAQGFPPPAEDSVVVDDHSIEYPPTQAESKEMGRNYRDEAAADLYRAAGVKNMAKAHAQMARALTAQAAKLETFYSTPFTEQNVATIKVTLEGIERVQRQLERWHLLLYPNQRPTEGHDVG